MIGLLGLVIVAGLLAFANGANDVGQGIATLVGSGVTSYRRAIVRGAVWTGLGAAVATGTTGAMAWVVTIPVAAILGATAYWLAVLVLA